MSQTDRTARRLALGLVANLFGQGMVVLSLIIITPIIVHAVGAADYGVWVLFGSAASFGFLLELGVAAALVKYVAEHAARDETTEAALMVGAATWLYAVSGALLAAAGLALAFLVPALVDLHGAFGRLFRPLAILVSLNVGISLLAVAPPTVLRGLQRYTAANVITGGGAALNLVGICVALILGTGIIGVGVAVAFSSTVTCVASFVIARRLAPHYTHDLFRRDGARARRLIRFSRSVAMIQVAIQLQSRLDAVVIAAALPIRLLTPYNFAQQLSTGISIVTEQFGSLLLPLASQVSATSPRSRLRELFVISTRVTLAIALAVGLPIAILGGPLLGLWVGQRYSRYGELVALLAVAAVLELTAYAAASVLQSIERHGPIAWMALSSGVLNVGLSVALVFPFGIRGVAIATLAATIAEMTFLVLPYAARVLEVPMRELLIQVLLRLLPAGAACAAVLAAGETLLPMTSAAALALVIAAGLLVYSLVYLTLGATTVEREAYRSLAASARAGSARFRRRSASTE